MTQKDRCRAKNPQTCWKHGSGVGFDANREIQNRLQGTRPVVVEPGVYSLKRMESPELAEHVVYAAQMLPDVNSDKVRHAVLLASDLHKTDTRSVRLHHDQTPYIEHPLRNTLRLIRLGCKSETVIIGSILHDTVEDHPFEMAEKAGVKTTDEQEAREACYKYIAQQYDERTAAMVKGMSNPITDKNVRVPWEEKNRNYAAHVVEAIENPDVLLGKVSDFIDNALSLHHTEAAMSPVGLHRKASKYLLVSTALRGRILAGMTKGDIPLSDTSLAKIYVQLTKGEETLRRIQQQYPSR